MEAVHKRRSGFMKSLYKAAAKPGYNRKVKPNPTAPNGSFGAKTQHSFSTASQTPSFANKPNFFGHSEAEVHVHRSCGDHGGDENVDFKASTYISCVQERFKLEISNSNIRMCKEMC